MHNVEDIYPLTPSQSGVLFHVLDGAAPGSYFVQVVLTLDGQLDPPRFRQAFEELVTRHTALRTAFFWEDLNQPVQVVRGRVALPWSTEDLRTLSPAESAARTLAWLAEDRARGFDVRRAPLMRGALLRTADTVHRFVWSFHHLIVDGWSWPVLWNEVRTLYAAPAGRLSSAPAFGAFVRWIAAQDVEATRAFWRDRLAGWRPVALPLASSTSSDAAASEVGTLEFALANADHLTLKASAREFAVTVGTLIQAAWAMVLAATTGEEDVTFGVVTAGRPAELPDIERTAGMFVNVLPFRARLQPAQSAGAWLRALQSDAAAQRQHEWASLADVQAWAGVRADTSMVGTVVVVQNYPLERDALDLSPDVRVTGLDSVEWNHYPLTIVMRIDEPVQARIRYRTALFDRAAIGKLVVQFRRALLKLAKAGDRTVADVLGSLAPAEPRVAAPPPAVIATAASPPFAPPRTALEASLAGIWQEVLGHPSVGVFDNFFDLGGHSLRAMQIVARVRRTLDVDLPMRAVFDSPTVAHLSAAIESRRAANDLRP
jgi:acyl carrier protein